MLDADRIRKRLTWMWTGTALLVLVLGVGLTPWDAISRLLTDQGVGDETASVLAFVAGYTLPMTFGFAALTLMMLVGTFDRLHGIQAVGLAALILLATIVLSNLAGLSQLDLGNGTYVSGAWWVTVPIWVLSTFLNSYGWSLSLCSLAIAVASGFTVYAYLPASWRATIPSSPSLSGAGPAPGVNPPPPTTVLGPQPSTPNPATAALPPGWVRGPDGRMRRSHTP